MGYLRHTCSTYETRIVDVKDVLGKWAGYEIGISLINSTVYLPFNTGKHQAMSSFRASPWVTYKPSTSYPNRQHPRPAREMDGDVEMEAPHISTLREEATPPPASMKSKSKSGWLKPHGWSKGPNGPPLHSGKPPHSPFTRDDQDEPEEEEDQLIDDDDNEDDALQPSATSSNRPTENRKLPGKKARKGNRTAVDTGERPTEKVPDLLGGQNLAPTMSCFKATTAESHEDVETASISQTKTPNDTTLVKAKKKVSPRKLPTMPRAKTKLAKYVYFILSRVALILLVRQKTAIPPLLHDDMGALSESRYSLSSSYITILSSPSFRLRRDGSLFACYPAIRPKLARTRNHCPQFASYSPRPVGGRI